MSKKTVEGIKGPNPGDPPAPRFIFQQRYQICGDNSGHDYFIPVEQVEAFYKWAEDEDPEDPELYNDNRIDGTFTFSDPRCE